MTENTTSKAGRNVPFGDREDVEYTERTYVHEEAEYCARNTDGRVIVGVTNDDGEVLLLLDDEREHAILPNCHVEDGDWRGVAHSTVEESTDIAVDLDGPELVRVVDHRLEGEDEPRERTYHVVFGATPAEDATDTDPTCDDEDWRASYCAEMPMALESETGDAKADIERFLG